MFATLLPGYLSIPDSYCSFIGCTAQNEFCRVSCLLRSEDGYLLTQADESLSLVVSLSNVYRPNSPETFEETYAMTNHWNGTFTIDLSVVWSGKIQLRVRDDRTQLYFAETLNATIPLLPLDYSKSIFSTALPESIQVREPILLQVLLYDLNSNMYCLESVWNEPPVEVFLDIEMESVCAVDSSDVDHASI